MPLRTRYGSSGKPKPPKSSSASAPDAPASELVPDEDEPELPTVETYKTPDGRLRKRLVRKGQVHNATANVLGESLDDFTTEDIDLNGKKSISILYGIN